MGGGGGKVKEQNHHRVWEGDVPLPPLTVGTFLKICVIEIVIIRGRLCVVA